MRSSYKKQRARPAPRRITKRVWPRFFEDLLEGKKNFDVRLNNFDVVVGDIIVFKEWDEYKKKYTGRKVEKKVCYILPTKPVTYAFWKYEDIEAYGYKILGLENIYASYAWCPIWQCGGSLHTRNAKYGKDTIRRIGEEVQWQIPEMVCDNCKSVFRCVTFEKKSL